MDAYELVLDALADPTRRAVLEVVARRPAPVADIARHLPVSRPAVSQHLGVLKRAGLVRDTAVGTRRIYRLHPQGADPLRRYLDDLWTDALERFAEAAERHHEERHDPDDPT